MGHIGGVSLPPPPPVKWWAKNTGLSAQYSVGPEEEDGGDTFYILYSDRSSYGVLYVHMNS